MLQNSRSRRCLLLFIETIFPKHPKYKKATQFQEALITYSFGCSNKTIYRDMYFLSCLKSTKGDYLFPTHKGNALSNEDEFLIRIRRSSCFAIQYLSFIKGNPESSLTATLIKSTVNFPCRKARLICAALAGARPLLLQ